MSKRSGAIAAAVAGVIILAAVTWGMVVSGDDAASDLTASGSIEATEADLGFRVPGQVATVAVREGDRVAAGQVLATLERAEHEARHAAAAAQLDAARALLAELEAGARPQELAQAGAGWAAAEQRLEDARRDLTRARALFEGGAVSREALDKAETAAEVAAAQASQAREQLALVRSGPRPERLDAQRAAVKQAEAVVAQMEATLADAVIRAPFAGVVTVRHREPGETVSPGAPVLTLMDAADRWVRIYVREDEVGRVSLGQPARILSDSHPDRAFDGRVTFIASEAEFTPRNVQTQEERVKLVYAVKVGIVGDAAMALKPGVPADVVLEAGAR